MIHLILTASLDIQVSEETIKNVCVRLARQAGHKVSSSNLILKRTPRGCQVEGTNISMFYSEKYRKLLSLSCEDREVDLKAWRLPPKQAWFKNDRDIWQMAQNFVDIVGLDRDTFKPWRFSVGPGSIAKSFLLKRHGDIFVMFAEEPFGYASFGFARQVSLRIDSVTGNIIHYSANINRKCDPPNIKIQPLKAIELARKKYHQMKSNFQVSRYYSTSVRQVHPTPLSNGKTMKAVVLLNCRLNYFVHSREGSTIVDCENGEVSNEFYASHPEDRLVHTSTIKNDIHNFPTTKNQEKYMTCDLKVRK